jgi:hypothetical protein
VTLTAGGITQMRDLNDTGGNTDPQRTHLVHFGLAHSQSIDSVTVRWPGADTEPITGLEPNGRYRVVQGVGQGMPLP